MRVALVTGAGAGIGKASALGLAKAGFVIVATGRRKDLLDATITAIAAAGGAGRAIVCDVQDPASIAALFAEIKSA
jgi:NADP-dependent 3-hydroxy acid dehydrogenase YdfG